MTQPLALRHPQRPAGRVSAIVGSVKHRDPPSPHPLHRSPSPPQVPYHHALPPPSCKPSANKSATATPARFRMRTRPPRVPTGGTFAFTSGAGLSCSSAPVPNPSPSHSRSKCTSFPRRRISSSAYAQSHSRLRGSAGKHDSETPRASPPGPDRPSSLCSPARASSIERKCKNALRGAVRSSPRKGGTIHRSVCKWEE